MRKNCPVSLKIIPPDPSPETEALFMDHAPDQPGNHETDIYFMELALEQAAKAGERGEVPVGAVLALKGGRSFAAGNSVIGLSDPTAHAEILAIRAASCEIGNYRLVKSALYSTIEPCIMCISAAVHARVDRLVFGCRDPRWGGAGSVASLHEDPRLNHHPQVTEGVLEERCKRLIQEFFRNKRAGATKIGDSQETAG